MCGIAGFIGNGDYEMGQKMIRSIKYRGPDHQAVFFKEPVCLCHARLSIIDLSESANQPMFSNDKSIAIVFNGEIYNFQELKEELIRLNKYSFQTSSDTEVLLYLYKEFGIDMLKKIHGMFSFAIYDFEINQCFLARDRMGKKPLYYSLTESGSFVFASELKSVLTHADVKKSLNIEALNQFLTFDYIPAPNTINENVFKLKPAHYMIVKEGEILKNEPYWKHDFSVNKQITFQEATEKFEALMDRATSDRLMSDVPLGVFLSGGLDSSTVAYFAQKRSRHRVKSFSIGFEDKSYDEQDYALQVSKHLDTEHTFEVLTPATSIELINEIFPLLDEPFADASIIPTYFLSKFTRKSVTVALGGDGSDEIFAGYPTFISDKFKGPFSYLPKQAIKVMLSAANLLPASDANISFDFKVKQFLRGFLSNSNSIHQLWLGSFLPDEKKNLFKKPVYAKLSDQSGLKIIDDCFEAVSSSDDFSKSINYYYQTYLPDDILVKVDRASMYNSLEVRAPFLDTDMVEFANSLPRQFKLRKFQGKYIIKKAMEDKLPHNIIYRAKKGFGIPLSDWIRNELKKHVEEVLLYEENYFEVSYIQQLLNQHQSGKYNHRKLLWNLYVLKRFIVEQGY